MDTMISSLGRIEYSSQLNETPDHLTTDAVLY